MTWIQTYTGRAVDLVDPKPETIYLDDIVWSLSMICRYTGHTRRFYSVLEHSCHVSDYLLRVAPAHAPGGLMHDTPEGYGGDMSYPMQLAIGEPARSVIKALHRRVWVAISTSLDVHPDIEHPLVKDADRRILLDERDAILGPPPIPWEIESAERLGVTIEGWSPERARREFLTRYATLFGRPEVLPKEAATLPAGSVRCTECFKFVQVDTNVCTSIVCPACDCELLCHVCGTSTPEFNWRVSAAVEIGGLWCSNECVGSLGLGR